MAMCLLLQYFFLNLNIHSIFLSHLVATSLIKTLLVRITKMHKIYKVYINLQCFDDILPWSS